MKHDSIMGYVIKALENLGKEKKEITKIIEEIFKLQETMNENEARSIYYDFPE